MSGESTNDGLLDCCIAGCGPAGAVLGLLLARAGLDVLVLEKHGDFLRDFRGDTIHPSTLELLDQLGLAERFLRLPHSQVATVALPAAAGVPLAFTFRRLKTRFPFIAFVPQWDFLDFITDEAARYPGFRLVMNAEVTDLVREDGVVRGVRYRTPDGEHAVRARLTVGADGRSSRTRDRAGLRPIETAAPIDVFWFRLPRRPDEPVALAGRTAPGRFAVLIDRGDYWQVGYLIPKGAADEIRAAGLDAFRRAVATLVPELADRVGELRDWDQVKLLTVQSNRLARWWKRGYLAIGDAAHAMSPVAGLGINVAIQDAVVAANMLWKPLREGRIRTTDLAAVQRRREAPIRITQALQAFVQRRVIGVALGATTTPAVPWPLRLLARTPLLRDLPARLVGLGIGRPRIESPALAAPVGPQIRDGRAAVDA